MSLKIVGLVCWDVRTARSRNAVCEGVIRKTSRRITETVAKGDTVCTFDSEELRAAQRDFLELLTSFMACPDAELDQRLRRARHRLTQVKLTKHQIRNIERYRKVLHPLPLLAPWAGLLTRVARVGARVQAGQELFAVAPHRVVMFDLPPEVKAEAVDAVRIAKIGGLWHFGRVVGPVGQAHGRGCYLFEFDAPDSAPPCDSEVSLECLPPEADKRPSLSDDEVLAAGGCPVHLRGLPYRQYQRRIEPNPPAQADAAKSASPREMMRAAERLHLVEMWPTSSFMPSRMGARAAQAIAQRVDLEFGMQHWEAQSMGTSAVSRRTIYLSRDCEGQIEAGRTSGAEGCAERSVRAGLPAPCLALLPNMVQVRLRRLGSPRLEDEVLLQLPLQKVGPHPRMDLEVFRLPLPSQVAWQDGTVVQVRLTDPASARQALMAPADCVVMMGRSAEVMAHSGPGRLTRCRVKVGVRQDGWVELCSGLPEGVELVRHLNLRMRNFHRFQAAMVGLWTLAHQSEALVRLSNES